MAWLVEEVKINFNSCFPAVKSPGELADRSFGDKVVIGFAKTHEKENPHVDFPAPTAF
jgi:hypothetical protein